MPLYDISAPIRAGMPSFPGDPPVSIEPVHQIVRGDAYNLSELRMGTHAGTHVDPPVHFLPNGASIDRVDLTALNGPCHVVRVPEGHKDVGVADLRGVLHGVTRVLFRSRNSERWAKEDRFFPDYVAVTPEAAEYLASSGLKLVGIDSQSVERDPTGRFPVHKTLLESGCLILEGVRLAQVPEGEYELRCLPLLVHDGDGGPCRAVLISP